MLDATLATTAAERIQRADSIALSLSEARDSRAFAMLAHGIREQPACAGWCRCVGSLHGRGLKCSTRSCASRRLSAVPPWRRDESAFAGTLNLVATAKPDTQAAVLDALAKGRKNAPRKPLADKSARAALATLAASPVAEVRTSARALEDSFVATVAEDESLVSSGKLPPVEPISEERSGNCRGTDGPRDPARPRDFSEDAPRHRIGNEDSEADRLARPAQRGGGIIVEDVLMPSERIRPGYETTRADARWRRADRPFNDGATSPLVQAGGIEHVLLRKGVTGVRRRRHR